MELCVRVPVHVRVGVGVDSGLEPYKKASVQTTQHTSYMAWASYLASLSLFPYL